MSMVAIVRIGIGHDPPHAAGLAAVAITHRMMSGLAGLLDANRLSGAKLRLVRISGDWKQVCRVGKGPRPEIGRCRCRHILVPRSGERDVGAPSRPALRASAGGWALGFADPASHRLGKKTVETDKPTSL
jgi:hypothetical protein